MNFLERPVTGRRIRGSAGPSGRFGAGVVGRLACFRRRLQLGSDSTDCTGTVTQRPARDHPSRSGWNMKFERCPGRLRDRNSSWRRRWAEPATSAFERGFRSAAIRTNCSDICTLAGSFPWIPRHRFHQDSGDRQLLARGQLAHRLFDFHHRAHALTVSAAGFSVASPGPAPEMSTRSTVILPQGLVGLEPGHVEVPGGVPRKQHSSSLRDGALPRRM